MEKISVVIPVYNTEKYLKECIESVINQTISFDKIIIINDGSTDNSLNICRRYEDKHSNIIIVNQENKGVGRTRNIAFKYISNGYIMFLDSDDYLEKDAVKKIKNEMKKRELDILYFDASIKNELAIHMDNHYNRVGRVDNFVKQGYEYFVKNYPETYIESACMAVFRMEFLKINNIKFPEERIFEDVYFTLNTIINANSIKYMPERLYVRRYRPNSTMTRMWNINDIDDICSIFKKSWRLLSNITDANEDTLDSFKIFLVHSYYSIKKNVNRVIDGEKEQVKHMKSIEVEFLKYWDKIKCYNVGSEQNIYVLSAISRLIKNVSKDSIIYNKFQIESDHLKLYQNELYKLLIALPFNNEDIKVGVYGVGNHTDKLIMWYEKLVGKIKCSLYFIDSYKKSFEERYKNNPIINIKDADKYIDIIIVSSIYYEKIMLDTISRLYSNNIPAISFYNKRNYDLLV